MQYKDLTISEKRFYKRINYAYTYSQLHSECLLWLKNSANYDGTREGLKLFMDINDIPNDIGVPTKRSLVLAVMLMHAQDIIEQQTLMVSPEFIDRRGQDIFLERCLALEL